VRKLAVLVVLALAASLAPAQAAPDPAPVVFVKHREYGDGVVRVPHAADEAHIYFHGHAADRVMLRGVYCGLSLSTSDGTPVPREASGFWRLPKRTTYVFEHRLCQHSVDVYLQLVKLVVHKLPINGPAVHVQPRQGCIKAVAVRVPARGRVQVTPDRFGGSEWPDMLLPDGTRSSRGNRYVTAPDVALEAGSPPMWQAGPVYGLEDLTLHRHDRVIFVVRKATTLVVSTSQQRDVTVDGPAVTATNVGRPYQETELAFDGVAGQWVHLEQEGTLVGRSDRYRYPSLVGPDGHVLVAAWNATHPFWRLPVTGRYRMLVETGAAPVSAQVRVRSIRVIGAMPTDGSPLTFTAASPGEWMLASFDIGDGDVRRLQAVGSDTAAGWTAFAESTTRFVCSFDDHPGCSDHSQALVDAGHPASLDPLGPDSWTVVVALPPTATGSVTVTLPEFAFSPPALP
jgi:hypothetical protein